MLFFKFLFYVSIFLLMGINVLFSQFPPCTELKGGTVYGVPQLHEIPKLNTGMPYDVLISYIALDSIAYNATYNQIYEFLARQTSMNDTMRTIMKYYYNLLDHDPILYYQTEQYHDTEINVEVGTIESLYLDRLKKLSSNYHLDLSLLYNRYIAHVRVRDTLHFLDTNGTSPGPGIKVIVSNSTVLDLIKGQRLPECLPNNYPKTDEIMENEDCFTFVYAPKWGRDIGGMRYPLLDENKQDWIKPGYEYIVFMSILNSCYENNTDYFYLRPTGSTTNSAVCMMFPVKNGMVYDPENEFGFGTNLDVITWKNMLRARINWIKQ
ncbi:MAG: hypothetical protein WC313_05555 [Candidatus Kapaibacterium sp.]|jgi:hypothetical protein|nr:hypothetical protein [Candidatus Kapabacteria bacterium]